MNESLTITFYNTSKVKNVMTIIFFTQYLTQQKGNTRQLNVLDAFGRKFYVLFIYSLPSLVHIYKNNICICFTITSDVENTRQTFIYLGYDCTNKARRIKNAFMLKHNSVLSPHCNNRRENVSAMMSHCRPKNIMTTTKMAMPEYEYPNQRKTQLSNKEHKNKQNNAIKELELIPEILVTEVEKSIKSQKMEKSPGPDRITNELMRGTTEELSPILTKVFNEILYTGRIPSQWAESHIILIHKKGPKDDIGNYRPISLISNVYKVFAKVILDRISLTLDENQPVEQAGFRKDFSTIDHIHTVKQLIQKYNEYNKTIYLAFIDYAKAFDSLKHESVWQSLREQGIQNSYVNIIKNIYSESKARIRLESIGETFPIEKGVRQGDPLSPKLFTAVLEQLFRKLDWGHLGLNINGTRLSHLRFADDLVILEEDPLTLESMIQTLVDRSREVGLEMNTSKTKMMTNSIPIDITINGQKLEYVEEYVYLGQIISPKDQMSKEIDKRIASGWKTFWALKEIMKSKELGMKIKKKTFDTCILPCITYGCETWALTKHHRDKLVRCQRSMERSMLGLKLMDKIRSTDIRGSTMKRPSVWADRKYLAKKAASASRQSASATGGGPSTAPPISDTDRRIISIMGEGFGSQQVEGRVPAFYPDREPASAASASTAAPPEGASQDDILLELPADEEQLGEIPHSAVPPQVSQPAESSSQNQSQAQPARRVLRARRGLPANSLGSRIMAFEEQRLNIEQRRVATEEAILNELRQLRMAIVDAIQKYIQS
ncbi:hypothetical protein ABMA28_004096 [Loxostege sticticalis]|uniref:Reverse transcriptase domain-containing protein n=1 Tax=Loxostege sticticalis TaxID=481309 RepID=A0ABD0SV75_LOXSC